MFQPAVILVERQGLGSRRKGDRCRYRGPLCQPPVAGTLTLPLRLVPDELERWNASVTALGAATRKSTVYVPAVDTLTVYLNH